MRTFAQDLDVIFDAVKVMDYSPVALPWRFEVDPESPTGYGWLLAASGHALAYGAKDEFDKILTAVNAIREGCVTRPA